jgi:hypothetical protein
MPRKNEIIKHFTVTAGRQILRDGEPFIGINREGYTSPTDADEITHVICDLLNLEADAASSEPKHRFPVRGPSLRRYRR